MRWEVELLVATLIWLLGQSIATAQICDVFEDQNKKPNPAYFLNPILNADFPDPGLLRHADGMFYVYGTQTRVHGQFQHIRAIRSRDLQTWENLGDLLPQGPGWGDLKSQTAAPQVVQHQNRYLLYYTAESKETHSLGLAVAVADQPEGPFVDIGHPLKLGPGFEDIDPHVFKDDDGTLYVFWGSEFKPIRGQKLSADGLSLKPGTQATELIATAPSSPQVYERLHEAPWVIKRNGSYIMFYSGDDGFDHHEVRVARATHPLGPWQTLGQARGTKSSAILSASKNWKSQGNNAIFTDDVGQDWILYPATPAKSEVIAGLSETKKRSLLMEPIEWVNGWPTVRGGVPSSALRPAPTIRPQKLLPPASSDRRLLDAQNPDPLDGPILERLKQITFNFWNPGKPKFEDPTESADPTRPIQMPNGNWRIDASGRDGFEYDTLSQLLHGGNQDARRFVIEKRWPDGTPTSGEYHTGNWGWDGLIALWPKTDALGKPMGGYEPWAYYGMMVQPKHYLDALARGLTADAPSMPIDNFSRSRNAMRITYENGREIWTSQGPVFGNQPLAPSLDPRIPNDQRGQWVSENHNHGYGGRPLMDNEGHVFQHDGSYWMIFEQVMEQKEVDHGSGATGYLPWVTEVVAKRMKNPYQGYSKGEKLPDGRPADETVVICSVRNADGTFNAASDRHGLGYLIEGFNLMGKPVLVNGKKFWIGFASPNNYTESYGITLWFRPFEQGPIGNYEPLVDHQGVWLDITASIRNQHNLQGWFGRGDGFFTPEQLLKLQRLEEAANSGGALQNEELPFTMIAHGVNPQSLPRGFPLTGWPTAQQYNYYIRAQFLLFGRFFEKDGKPAVRWISP